MLTGRREDRLLFDYQIKLAKLFGYEDASFTLAVEQLMQKYYRTVMDVSLLNEMLLQLFREAILTQSGAPRADQRALSDPQRLFGSDAPGRLRALPLRPCSSCSCFCSSTRKLRGVRAETIRLIGTHVCR